MMRDILTMLGSLILAIIMILVILLLLSMIWAAIATSFGDFNSWLTWKREKKRREKHDKTQTVTPTSERFLTTGLLLMAVLTYNGDLRFWKVYRIPDTALKDCIAIIYRTHNAVDEDSHLTDAEAADLIDLRELVLKNWQ